VTSIPTLAPNSVYAQSSTIVQWARATPTGFERLDEVARGSKLLALADAFSMLTMNLLYHGRLRRTVFSRWSSLSARDRVQFLASTIFVAAVVRVVLAPRSLVTSNVRLCMWLALIGASTVLIVYGEEVARVWQRRASRHRISADNGER
jgi:hypothetical protein